MAEVRLLSSRLSASLDDLARSESWIGDGLFGVDRRCGDCLGAVECPGRAARVVRSFRRYD